MDDENIVLPLNFIEPIQVANQCVIGSELFLLKTANELVKTSKQCSLAGLWGCLWLGS